MKTEDMFKEVLEKNLEKISDAVLKKLDEKSESTKTPAKSGDDKTTDKKSDTETPAKSDEEKNTPAGEEEVINGLVEKIFTKIKSKLDEAKPPVDKDDDEESADDTIKNLTDVLSKAGIDVEDYEITIKDKKKSTVLNTKHKSDKELEVSKDADGRPVVEGLDELESEDRKKALSEFMFNIIKS